MTGTQNFGPEMTVEPGGNLPVFRTVLIAYRFVIGQPAGLITALAVPFVLWILLYWEVSPLILETFHVAQPPTDEDSRRTVGMDELVAGAAVRSVFWAFALTLFGVAWYRFVLLGPVNARPRPIDPWRRRHWRFFGYLLLLDFVFHVPTGDLFLVAIAPYIRVPFSLLDNVGIFLLDLVISYWAVRLSLVLPAGAIDQELTLRQSWSRTQGQGLRLLVAIYLSMLPYILIAELLPWGYAFVDPLFDPLRIGQTLITLIYLMSIAVTVTMLSLAFRHLTEWQPPSEADRQEPVVEE
jgi:hypothetical protein